MSRIYCVHAASVGKAAITASRTTIDAALREAKLLLRSGYDFVWVDDAKGNVILPAAAVKARLDVSSPGDRRRREPKEALRVHGAMRPFDHDLDEPAHSVSYARQASDARFRTFLIDLAETRFDLAQEFLDASGAGLEPGKSTDVMAELYNSDRQAAPAVEGLEPDMVPGLKPRTFH
jgi:hypothetical protein